MFHNSVKYTCIFTGRNELINPVTLFITANANVILSFLPGILGLGTALLDSRVRKAISMFFSPIGSLLKWATYPVRFPAIIMEQNEKILKELYSENGTSLRDAINLMHQKQTQINDRILNIMDHDKSPIFETDHDGLFVWVNNAYSLMTGRSMQELMGYGWINGVYEPDREKVSAQWDLAVEERRTFELIFSYRHIDGHVYSAFIRATPVRSDGILLGWTGYVTLLDVDQPTPGKPTEVGAYNIQQYFNKVYVTRRG